MTVQHTGSMSLSHLTSYYCQLGEQLLSLVLSTEYPGSFEVGGNVSAL